MDLLLSIVCIISFLMELLFTAWVLGDACFNDGACGAIKDTFVKGIKLYEKKNILGIMLSTIICILGIPALLLICLLGIIEIAINVGLNVWELGNKQERV